MNVLYISVFLVIRCWTILIAENALFGFDAHVKDFVNVLLAGVWLEFVDVEFAYTILFRDAIHLYISNTFINSNVVHVSFVDLVQYVCAHFARLRFYLVLFAILIY